MIDPVFELVLRGGLALLLLTAATHKLGDLHAFRASLADYRLLPAWLVGAGALGVPTAELLLAAALLARGGAVPASACALLFALYGAAIGINLARGRRGIACGCGGPAGDQPLHAGLLLRSALLVAAAAAAALPTAPRALVWLDFASVAGGVASLALLYAAADVALANAARQQRLRSPA